MSIPKIKFPQKRATNIYKNKHCNNQINFKTSFGYKIFVLLLTGIVQAIRKYTQGTFILTDYAILMTLLLIISCITSSISLPFMFKLGVEKGRMAYYIMIGFVCASSVIASSLFQEHLQVTITWSSFIFLLAIASIAIYICSWYLSIVFYKKREIS